MIDYFKLKEVHELADKLKTGTHGTVILRQSVYFDGDKKTHEYFNLIACEENETIYHVDDLIMMLKKLTKPDPKFKDGQEVWFIDCKQQNGPITKGKVNYSEYREHLFGEYKYYVRVFDGYYIPEDCLYPSREELIEAQIEYWTSIKKEKIIPVDDSCEHEYTLESGFACVKCGENSATTIYKDATICEHESDGMVYCSYPPQNKCKKLLEFYR